MGDPVLPSPEIADGNPVLLREPFSRLAESLGCGAIYDPDSMRPPRPKYQDDISMHLSKLRPEGLPPSVTFEFPTELVDSTDRYRWAERVLMAWSGVKYLLGIPEEVYPQQVLHQIVLGSRVSNISKAHSKLGDIYPEALEIIEGCTIPEEDLSDDDRKFLSELKKSNTPYTIYTAEYSLQYGVPINEKARVVNVVYRVGNSTSGYGINNRVITPHNPSAINKITDFAHQYKLIGERPPHKPPFIGIADFEVEKLMRGEEIYIPRYLRSFRSPDDLYPALIDQGRTEADFILKVYQLIHKLSYLELASAVDKLLVNGNWSPNVSASSFRNKSQFWGLFREEIEGYRNIGILSVPGIIIRRNALNSHNPVNKNPNILMQGITYQIEIPFMHLGRPVAAKVINIGLYVTMGPQSSVVQIYPLVHNDSTADSAFKADLSLFSQVAGVSAQSARHRDYWNRIKAYRGGLVRGR